LTKSINLLFTDIRWETEKDLEGGRPVSATHKTKEEKKHTNNSQTQTRRKKKQIIKINKFGFG